MFPPRFIRRHRGALGLDHLGEFLDAQLGDDEFQACLVTVLLLSQPREDPPDGAGHRHHLFVRAELHQ